MTDRNVKVTLVGLQHYADFEIRDFHITKVGQCCVRASWRVEGSAHGAYHSISELVIYYLVLFDETMNITHHPRVKG